MTATNGIHEVRPIATATVSLVRHEGQQRGDQQDRAGDLDHRAPAMDAAEQDRACGGRRGERPCQPKRDLTAEAESSVDRRKPVGVCLSGKRAKVEIEATETYSPVSG